VVDDEESVRSAAAIMLERLGFRVSLACDGREAVKVFQDEPDRFTLILMDLTMPHLDGESAFTELRRIKGDVRVVLMSGFNEQEAISRFTGKGLASFLQKPFGFDDLNRVLQGVFSRPPGLK
jgi:DNA-binding NtrC family response regulator